MADYLERFSNGGRASPTVYANLAHFVILPTIEAEIVRIEELDPPAGDRGRIDSMISAERLQIDKLATSRRISSVEAVERSFKAAGRRLRAYGLTGCTYGLG